MRINHNIAAINTYNKLSSNSAATSGSLEKLSSGLKINKAGDDAAGLAISEKMRGQIRGLDMAQKNAQDGISLIQTAEGALNETHSILQRMRELSVQSASDSNNDNDRAELQKEVDQLSEEIQRISKDTEFNTKKLINGQASDLTFHIGANKDQSISLSINDMSASELKVGTKFTADATGATVSYKDAAGADATATWQAAETATVSADGSTYTPEGGTAATWQAAVTGSADPADDSVAGYYESGALVKAADEKLSAGEHKTEAGYYTDGELVLKSETKLAANAEAIGGINISDKDSANEAITTIQTAIDTVSAERSKLGAYQNRLDHTINNLGTSSENLTAAESRIRDVDYSFAA
jgi:flagellin